MQRASGVFWRVSLRTITKYENTGGGVEVGEEGDQCVEAGREKRIVWALAFCMYGADCNYFAVESDKAIGVWSRAQLPPGLFVCSCFGLYVAV